MAKRIKIDSHQVHIEDDANGLIAALTTYIRAAANAQRQQQRHYYLSLAGGTTPKQLYTSLAKELLVLLIRSISAARVVDLPDPVGPVTTTSPLRTSANLLT